MDIDKVYSMIVVCKQVAITVFFIACTIGVIVTFWHKDKKDS